MDICVLYFTGALQMRYVTVNRQFIGTQKLIEFRAKPSDFGLVTLLPSCALKGMVTRAFIYGLPEEREELKQEMLNELNND